jgi:hypothetical protein
MEVPQTPPSQSHYLIFSLTVQIASYLGSGTSLSTHILPHTFSIHFPETKLGKATPPPPFQFFLSFHRELDEETRSIPIAALVPTGKLG